MNLLKNSSLLIYLSAITMAYPKPAATNLNVDKKVALLQYVEEIEKTDALTEVFSQNKPVVLLFYTDWCSACKALKPHLDKLAKQYHKHARFVKINAENDDCKKAIEFFGIEAIPTLVFKKVGIMDEKQLEGALKNFLGKEAQPEVDAQPKKVVKPAKNNHKKEKTPKKTGKKK